VPLRRNQQNTLIASAIDDLAAAPKPVASAPPVQVVHADPSEIVVASASSRPLTTEEVETLVQNGVIKLDDPTNYNVSMFTIVLTIARCRSPSPSGAGAGSAAGRRHFGQLRQWWHRLGRRWRRRRLPH